LSRNPTAGFEDDAIGTSPPALGANVRFGGVVAGGGLPHAARTISNVDGAHARGSFFIGLSPKKADREARTCRLVLFFGTDGIGPGSRFFWLFSGPPTMDVGLRAV
jgi:hypothetical protein